MKLTSRTAKATPTTVIPQHIELVSVRQRSTVRPSRRADRTRRPVTDPFAVLLDVDGTLVDSNYFHTLAWHRAFRGAGITIEMADIHQAIGMGADQLLQHLLGPGDFGDELELRWHEEFLQFVPEIQPTPGGRDLIRVLAGHGAVNIYATSGQEQDVTSLRKVIDADAWIHDAVNASEVRSSKPAPDIFELAIERAGVPAHRAVVVGDTIWDVQAAAAAGIACIALTSGGIARQALYDSGATEVYRTPHELATEMTTSCLRRFFA
jgi:HAD superfamily hydrolase (TIGR01549 family)